MNFKWAIGAVMALALSLILVAPAGATEGNQNQTECEYGSFQVKDQFIPGHWTYKDKEVKDYFVPPVYETEYQVKVLVQEGNPGSPAEGYTKYEYKKWTPGQGWIYNWFKFDEHPGHASGWFPTGNSQFVETKPAVPATDPVYDIFWTTNPPQGAEVLQEKTVKVEDGYWVYKTIQVKDEYIRGYWTYKTVCKAAECSNPLYFEANLDECDPIVEVCVDGQIGEYRTSQAPEDTGDCEIIEVCINGQFASGTVSELDGKGTNDCEPVRICANGDSQTVTEYQAEKIDFEHLGSCVPQEDPPPPSETDPEPQELVEETEEVEEVLSVVAGVSPVIDEVAVLPAAGNGTTGGNGIAWALVFGMALIGVGGATVLAARRS